MDIATRRRISELERRVHAVEQLAQQLVQRVDELDEEVHSGTEPEAPADEEPSGDDE